MHLTSRRRIALSKERKIKTAFVTGITGQDGSFLAEHLLDAGYQVHGLVRDLHAKTCVQLQEICGERSRHLNLHAGSLADTSLLQQLLSDTAPDECYHLAGQSHVGLSFEEPVLTYEVNAGGTLGLLEILRKMESPPKFLHASSSEVFGVPEQVPQTSQTAMRPVSPYGASKSFASQLVKIYRENHGLFACNAYCYNHESARRSPRFVTRKITQAVARIKLGLQENVVLGNLDGQRDWGYAPDFVRGFHALLQASEAQDVVLGTGQKHSVRDWLTTAFAHVDLPWEDYVQQDEKLMRKADPCLLVADPQEPFRAISWKPQTEFADMVRAMVDFDLQASSQAGN